MSDTSFDLLDDLATVNKANWDASWAANNEEEVAESHQRLVTALRQHAALLAEAERLREIVQAVATEDTCAYEDDAGDDVRCVFCAGEDDWREARARGVMHFIRHTPDCPVTKARALLAEDATP